MLLVEKDRFRSALLRSVRHVCRNGALAYSSNASVVPNKIARRELNDDVAATEIRFQRDPVFGHCVHLGRHAVLFLERADLLTQKRNRPAEFLIARRPISREAKRPMVIGMTGTWRNYNASRPTQYT